MMADKNYTVISILIILIQINTSCAGQHDIYSGYSVHGVELRDRSDAAALHQLELDMELDVWQHGSPGARDALVMVSPALSSAFLDQLDDYGMKHYLDVADVAKSLNDFDEERLQYQRNKGDKMATFEDFPRHDEVNAYLEQIAQQYPEIASVVTAGLSYEGRDVKYLKISSSNFSDPSKPIYFVDAMIHAREWATTPVALYTIHRLVEDLRDEDRDLLRDVDWIVLPVVNPDGYEYTHTNVRLWRRTRSFNANVSEDCYGVDANRNFDANFNTIGVSSNPCSDIYPGHIPFSDVESQYIRNIMFENLDRIQLYLNIHSHGNYVLFGFGNSTLPNNAVNLYHVAATMGAVIDGMKLPEASYYLVGNSALALYGTSGSAQDYGQAIGIPFSYTLELPGYGFGFQIPAHYINHVNEETWAGIAATARLARTYYAIDYNNRT